MIKTIISSVILVTLTIGQASATNTTNENSTHMITAGRTLQPIGHYEYCKKYRRDCNILSWKTKPTKLTRGRWKELVSINTHINHAIKPVSDIDAYNQDEVWAYPTSIGDCEDYALLKRKMLMDRGWPASSLLITIVKEPNGNGHAVLTVRTDNADYILDNLRDEVTPWNKTHYTFVKRQNVRNSGNWTTIVDKRF